MRTDLWKNFLGMPTFVKLVAVSGLLSPIFIVLMILTNSPVSVFGRDVQDGAWWYSGGGPLTILAGIILYISGVLMLKRNTRGRFFYVSAWIVMTISILIVAASLDALSARSITVFISNFILTVIIGLYLYLNPVVQKYFQ